MDTSSNFIEMCGKAEEIQKEWKPITGDYVYSTIKDKTVVLYWSDHHGCPPAHYIDIKTAIWIPRQDQLQEIFIKERKKELDNLMSILRDMDSIYLSLIWMFDNNFLDPKRELFDSYDERVTHKKYVAKFTSLEQLWLAFVMWELYDKIWDDDKVDWVSK